MEEFEIKSQAKTIRKLIIAFAIQSIAVGILSVFLVLMCSYAVFTANSGVETVKNWWTVNSSIQITEFRAQLAQEGACNGIDSARPDTSDTPRDD